VYTHTYNQTCKPVEEENEEKEEKEGA